jgi:threonine/homoserine/homoserine lactone efflux protein
MLDFIPDWSRLLPFLVAGLSLNLTPGADMTYVLARSAGQGRGAGVVSAFGVSAGSLVHSLLAAVGVSALLASSPTLFLAIQYGGAAYLLYLAWKAWRGATQPLAMQERPRASLTRVFLEGAWTNLLNPKVALFILAFLPQFVDPARGHVIGQMLFLGLLFNIGGTSVNLVVALVVGWISDHLRQSARFALYVGRFSALVMLWLAVQTLFLRRAAPA